MAEMEATLQMEANGATGQMEAASSASVAVQDRPVDERLLFCAEVLIGYKVEVQLIDGTVYEGIFHTIKVDGRDTHVVLKYAKVARDPGVTAEDLQATAKKPEHVRLFHSDDIAGIVAKDVRMSPEDLGAEQYDVGFETDAAISRGRGGLVNRELVAWMPDPDDSADASMFSLDESGPGWDQFAVNESKFGYQTAWNEEHYTVRLDREKCGIDEETAARIAREIERGDTSNPHLAEERGQELDDSGLDEEDKYSGVIRPEDLARLRSSAHHHLHTAQQQNGTAAAPPPQPKPAAWSRAGSGLSALTGAVQQQQQRPQTAPQQPPGLANPSPVAAAAAAVAAAAAAAAAQSLVAPPGLPPPATASAPVSIPARPSGGSSSGNASAGSAPGYSTSPGMAGSAPGGEIDPRKEVNKMRMSLTGGSLTKNRTSPFGTPKGMKSPLLSPLISDPQKLAALNLEPGVTKVDEDTRQEFIRFKAQLRQQDATNSALSSALQAGKQTSSLTAAVAAGQAADDQDAAPAAPPGIDIVPGSGTPKGEAAAAGGEGKAGAKPPAPKSKLSKLNPNAKPFTLNINAKPFVPTGFSSAAAPAAGATAAAGPSHTSSTTATVLGAEDGSSIRSTSQQQHMMHAVPAGVGTPPGLGVTAQGVAVPQSSGTMVAICVPANAAAAAAAAAAGGPPPGLSPVPGRMQQPPPPLGPNSVTGVASSSLPGHLLPVPPPPTAALHVGAVTAAGAMLPAGAVPGGMMPAAAMIPGVVPGTLQLMGGQHQQQHLQPMAGAGPAGSVGVGPSGMLLAPQGLGHNAAVAPAAVTVTGLAPPPPNMMTAAAGPGMIPVTAMPRPPPGAAAAAAAAAAMKAAGQPGMDRHADQRGGPHPPPRGHKGQQQQQQVDRDSAAAPMMVHSQQLQGPPAVPPPHQPPLMRSVGGVVMTHGGPAAVGLVPPPAPGVLPIMPGQTAVDGMPGQQLPGPAAAAMAAAAAAAAGGVPPPMHPGGEGVLVPPPQLMAAGPGMTAVPLQQPLPPMLHRGGGGLGPQGPDGGLRGVDGFSHTRGDHGGQDGPQHRGHREPRSRGGYSHDRDGEHTPTPPGSSGSTPNHMVYARQQQQQQPTPMHSMAMQHFPMGGPDIIHAAMAAGPGGPMHVGHHGPPHMPYGSSAAMMQQQQHSRASVSSSGPDSGHMGRVVSSSTGGPPPGIGAMVGPGMLPPHTPPHMLDGPGSGPNSGSAMGLNAALGYSPHPGPPGAAGHHPPHGMQPAPPLSRVGEGNSSFSSQQGPPSGSHGLQGGPSDGSSTGAGGSSGQGQPGGPHPPPYGPPHGSGSVMHPGPVPVGMSSGGMHPGGMQPAMMPLMPPAMMAQLQGQPMLMPYPGGPQGPGGMMMMNHAGGAFMVPAGMQPPYMAYMAGPGGPPAGSSQARPAFFPPGAYPMPLSPGGTVMRPPAAAQQPGQHTDGPISHGGGGPGTPTAPSPHGPSGLGRTPGSGNRDRTRGPRGQGGLQHDKRGSAGDVGHVMGSKLSGVSGVGPVSVGSAPATPPGMGDGESGGAVNGDA